MSAVLIIAFVVGLYQGQWFNSFLAFLTFILSYIPALVERNYRITLPVEFEFIMVTFLFLSIYLGGIHGYYGYFWWWDSFLHGLSGVILGLVGFLIVYVLRTGSRFHLNISPGFVGIFSFLFAVTLGTLWEILEFLIDLSSLDTTALQPDNFDTMKDLIDDSLGALVASLAGYLYSRNVRVPFFHRIVHKFIEKNPSLFQRLRINSKRFFRGRIDAVRRIKHATLTRVKTLLTLIHKKRSKRGR